MPQPGVHAVFALASRRFFPSRRWFALGLVFGALIPDLDSYAQAAAFLIGRMTAAQAEAVYHRTLTHSLFFAAGVALIFAILSVIRGGKAVRTFGLGVATGIAVLHIFIDIFAWFDGVGILWPLWSVDLWGWFTPPEVVRNLLRAGDFYAIAGYFAYLMILAHRGRTDAGYLPRLRLYAVLQLGLGAVFTVLAVLLSEKSYNIPDGVLFLFWAYPNALWVTWQMRETIAGRPLGWQPSPSAIPPVSPA